MDGNLDKIDLNKLETPCFVADEELIEKNLKILKDVQDKADCRIILALKAFSMFSTFPLIRKYLHGICASGLHEARLGKEEFQKEVHTYAPAFKDEEFEEVVNYSDHIVFNSLSQFKKFREKLKGKKAGIRINPEVCLKTSKFTAYDPCSKNSRLGIKLSDMPEKLDAEITGLHFHALCEQDAEDLEEVLKVFERNFDKYIKQISWINFGGGHHITRENYNIDKLISLIKNFRKKYPNIKQIYLEPGEAIVLNAGYLVARVLDIVRNEKEIAILDCSAETHMPDIMITRHDKSPYIPPIMNAGEPGENKYEYTLAGVSCAAGDIIADYSFKNKLKIGDKVVFEDALLYNMVMTSTFNGVQLPAIYIIEKSGNLRLVKKFGYHDFKSKLS